MSDSTQPRPGYQYTILEGDTLVSIAQQAYGQNHSDLWQGIYKANLKEIGDNPEKLVPGTVIFIPASPSLQPTPGSTYIMQEGDTLISIARQAYHDESPDLWQGIYTANTLVIGDNPKNIVPGMEIFIPFNPPVAHSFASMSAVPLNPQLARSFASVNAAPRTCTIVWQNLNIRATPNMWSTPVDNYPQGTPLNFYEVVEGEMINGNPWWGHSVQGHYYTMAGTDQPNW